MHRSSLLAKRYVETSNNVRIPLDVLFRSSPLLYEDVSNQRRSSIVNSKLRTAVPPPSDSSSSESSLRRAGGDQFVKPKWDSIHPHCYESRIEGEERGVPARTFIKGMRLHVDEHCIIDEGRVGDADAIKVVWRGEEWVVDKEWCERWIGGKAVVDTETEESEVRKSSENVLVGSVKISSLDWFEVMSSQRSARDLLDKFWKDGSVIVKNCPDVPLESLASDSSSDSISSPPYPPPDDAPPCLQLQHLMTSSPPSHTSMYSTPFNVYSRPQAANVAYTSKRLAPHQDMCYYESPPGIQILHCIRNAANVKGGESTIVDLHRVVEGLSTFNGTSFDDKEHEVGLKYVEALSKTNIVRFMNLFVYCFFFFSGLPCQGNCERH